eukprot:jgi/Picsp_1/2080/NSC_05545-R1_---NA---
MFAISPSVPKCGFYNGTANLKRTCGHQSLGSRTVYGLVRSVLKPCFTVSGNARSQGDTKEQAEVESTVVLDRRFLLCRAVLVSLLSVTHPYPASAAGLGKNTRELAKASQARRERLRETAQKMKQGGKDVPAFAKSEYSMPEEATTPNIKNRNNVS